MARSVRRWLIQEARELQPDVLDVHYAFPDGVAALRLREQLSRALPRILNGYRQMGFDFVMASDMMRGS